MKKLAGMLLALVLAMGCVLFVACEEPETSEPVAVAVVVLDKESATMRAGETLTLTATVKPDDAADKTVAWTSSDESVATVTGGVVTAVSGGTATITAKAGEKSATCTVKVQEVGVAFDGIDKGTNEYTISEDIQVSYDDATKTFTLTGKSWYVTPWFGQTWTEYNYITVGVLLPEGFEGKTVNEEGGKAVYSSSILRYDVSGFDAASGDVWEEEGVSYWKTTVSGDGTTPLATQGAAAGYLDFSFAANSANTVKENVFRFKVVFNEGDEAVTYAVDISGLELISSAKEA